MSIPPPRPPETEKKHHLHLRGFRFGSTSIRPRQQWELRLRGWCYGAFLLLKKTRHLRFTCLSLVLDSWRTQQLTTTSLHPTVVIRNSPGPWRGEAKRSQATRGTCLSVVLTLGGLGFSDGNIYWVTVCPVSTTTVVVTASVLCWFIWAPRRASSVNGEDLDPTRAGAGAILFLEGGRSDGWGAGGRGDAGGCLGVLRAEFCIARWDLHKRCRGLYLFSEN
ncbi:hypothetical protein FPV67DRAFT_362442 [Lyophyllum atratum]|nr:hypothetical protein FPV67DRAFT_362442 [Lyophyllum atratum]